MISPTEQAQLTRLIYLWTRDAKLPVDQGTRDYVAQQLQTFDRMPVYSDLARAIMAEQIATKFSGGNYA